MATDFSKPTKFDSISLASVMPLMPSYEDIPKEFRILSDNKWARFTAQWFFEGVDAKRLVPREGVDRTEALRHCSAILRSFEPKHEHKEAAVAYLLSLWFEDVKERS